MKLSDLSVGAEVFYYPSHRWKWGGPLPEKVTVTQIENARVHFYGALSGCSWTSCGALSPTAEAAVDRRRDCEERGQRRRLNPVDPRQLAIERGELRRRIEEANARWWEQVMREQRARWPAAWSSLRSGWPELVNERGTILEVDIHVAVEGVAVPAIDAAWECVSAEAAENWRAFDRFRGNWAFTLSRRTKRARSRAMKILCERYGMAEKDAIEFLDGL